MAPTGGPVRATPLGVMIVLTLVTAAALWALATVPAWSPVGQVPAVGDSVPVEGGEPDIALDSERAMKGLRKLVRKLGGGEA